MVLGDGDDEAFSEGVSIEVKIVAKDEVGIPSLDDDG